jgi:hypothetical protein
MYVNSLLNILKIRPGYYNIDPGTLADYEIQIRPCNNFTTIILDHTAYKVCEALAGGDIDWIAGQNMAT